MLRLLSPVSAPGAWQMACDEALLGTAAVPTLRCYRFDPPCVSLGYFQDYTSVRAQLPGRIDIVRRITGGGAIWHEHEVTYALVGVLGEAGLPERSRDLYPLIHGAINDAVVAAGGRRLGEQREAVGDRRYRDEPRCFASPAAHDLLSPAGDATAVATATPPGKVLGSAARTRGRRVLLHGSLKLASNPWDGPATGACGLDAEAAQQAIETGVAQALGLVPTPGELTTEETDELDRIQALRYRDDAWVVERRGPKG